MINQNGDNLGVVPFKEALEKAEEADLDLVQITDNATPPVCKIRDYGKYTYEQEKKKQQSTKKNKAGELKEVQLTFKISDHDLEVRKKRTIKFLDEGHKVRVRMRLRGREHALLDFAKEKMREFLEQLDEEVGIKMERRTKKERGGLIAIIRKE